MLVLSGNCGPRFHMQRTLTGVFLCGFLSLREMPVVGISKFGWLFLVRGPKLFQEFSTVLWAIVTVCTCLGAGVRGGTLKKQFGLELSMIARVSQQISRARGSVDL